MAHAARREAMGRVDKAWLEMDRETNLMVINGVLLFDEQVEVGRLRELFQKRMADRYVRFRQRVVESPPGSGRLYWERDPYFDIRSHLLHIALPEPGSVSTLQELISDLSSTDLDRTKPLWRVYLIDNVAGGSAIFARFHHCIADGIALIQVMLSMADVDPTRGQAAATEDEEFVSSSGGRSGVLDRPMRLALRTAQRLTGLAVLAAREGVGALRDPQQAIDAARSAGLLTAASAAVLARLLLIPPDRRSIYRGPLSTTKRVVWSAPVDLRQVKAIGRAMGGTVNDVLIGALTGALRSHMIGQGDDPEAGDLRAMVPVNLRDAKQTLRLGNEFGLVYLSLPVSIEDPLRRLYEVKRRMDALKQSPEAVVAYQVLSVLGLLPGDLAAWGVEIFAGKASVVLTNVPGPQQTLYFAGRPIRHMMFWVPQSGDIGLGISIISYDGSVTLGIMIDENLSSDPSQLMVGFRHEFDVLAKLTHQLANPTQA